MNSCGAPHVRFLRIVRKLVQKYGETVKHELQKLGLGVAWTMDEHEVGAILRETKISDSNGFYFAVCCGTILEFQCVYPVQNGRS